MDETRLFRYTFTIAVDRELSLSELKHLVTSSPGYDSRRFVVNRKERENSIAITLAHDAARELACVETFAFPNGQHFDRLDLEFIVDDYRLSDMFEPKMVIRFKCKYQPMLEMQAILTTLLETELYSDCLVELILREREVFRRGYGWLTDWSYAI